jgi:MFS family permease
MKTRIFSRTVILLGFVSLLNDISSEMLIPIMPVYLNSIGFSVLWIGVIEGVAEAVSGISKSYFGSYSDQIGKRVPFVRIGYLMSTIAKPMLSLFNNPAWVLLSRTSERLSKGVRTASRDAILASESSKENRAKVFGFHKSMDTLGAALGPVVALIWLSAHPTSYKPLFLIAFIPGLFAASLTFLLKEPNAVRGERRRPSLKESFLFWKQSSHEYRRVVIGILFFTLFNSSDAFLLLKMKAAGITDTWILLIYIFFNVVAATLSYPAGVLADKFGMKKIFLIGMILFSAVYLGFGYSDKLYQFFILFGVYAVFTAMTDGVSKAWVSLIVPPEKTATAIGFLTGAGSMIALLSSSLAGLVWTVASPSILFLFTFAGVLFTALYMTLVVKEEKQS